MLKLYPNKNKYNFEIPANIFQTWHTKSMPPNMVRALSLIKKFNPHFNHYLYDGEDCRNFIKNNFNQDVLNAYDSLIPAAYKADLWRYCILYKYGGIYLDVKYMPVLGFRFINLLEKEHFCLDISNNNVYNAILVCKAGNDKLMQAINKIVENVQQKNYGEDSLDPTGPMLLGRLFSREEKNNFDMKHSLIDNNMNNRIVIFNNYIILRSYPDYIKESSNFKKTEYYAVLWDRREIYR